MAGLNANRMGAAGDPTGRLGHGEMLGLAMAKLAEGKILAHQEAQAKANVAAGTNGTRSSIGALSAALVRMAEDTGMGHMLRAESEDSGMVPSEAGMAEATRQAVMRLQATTEVGDEEGHEV